VAGARAAHVDSAMIVSHGAAIRTWAGARVANLTGDFVIEHGLVNAGVVALSGSPEDGWTCERWVGAVLESRQAVGVGPAGEPGSVF
ncbi:MAG: hypothetical protein ACRYF3_08480, partial [Janthinobacterium lividum]